MSTHSCTITARDFMSTKADGCWETQRWSSGAMRHVVAALAGNAVAITVEKRTGSTMVGVYLVGVLATGDSGPGERVVVETVLADGTTSRTNFRLDEIGHVIPLDETGRGAKWTALETYREEAAAAGAAAKATAPDWTYGKISTRHFTDFVDVSYESQGEGPRHDYRRVALSEI